jgi:peptide/nickel transport system permease protein
VSSERKAAAADALRAAYEAMQRGDRAQARRSARLAVHLAPELEAAWLYLAANTDPPAARAYLDKALEINPQSPTAQKALRWLERQLPSRLVRPPRRPLLQRSKLQRLGRLPLLRVNARLTILRGREAWRIFRRNRLALLGLALMLLFAVMAVVHPLLMGRVWPKGIYDPVVGYDIDIFPHPSSPSSAHWLGTDTLGRDVLSILLAASRPTFLMVVAAALTAAVIGTVVAALSAYYRGWVDAIFAHLADVALLAPAPLVMVVIGFVLDVQPLRFGLLYGILAGLGTVGIVLRSHALTVMAKPFIEASRVAGAGGLHILLGHLIPHLLPLAAVNMMLVVTGAIFANGFVGFLGLSRAQLNWGTMIYDAFTYMGINDTIPWNVLLSSASAISLFAAAFYLVAGGLHDVADPRQRR